MQPPKAFMKIVFKDLCWYLLFFTYTYVTVYNGSILYNFSTRRLLIVQCIATNDYNPKLVKGHQHIKHALAYAILSLAAELIQLLWNDP